MNSITSGLKILACIGFASLGLPSIAFAAHDSSNPEAAVPAITYRSIFRETSLGVEKEKIDWRKANDDVGKFTRGHVDILKQEDIESKAMDKKAMEDKKSMGTQPMPAKPTPQTAPAPHKH
jgi:hypothetical protein